MKKAIIIRVNQLKQRNQDRFQLRTLAIHKFEMEEELFPRLIEFNRNLTASSNAPLKTGEERDPISGCFSSFRSFSKVVSQYEILRQ